MAAWFLRELTLGACPRRGAPVYGWITSRSQSAHQPGVCNSGSCSVRRTSRNMLCHAVGPGWSAKVEYARLVPASTGGKLCSHMRAEPRRPARTSTPSRCKLSPLPNSLTSAVVLPRAARGLRNGERHRYVPGVFIKLSALPRFGANSHRLDIRRRASRPA